MRALLPFALALLMVPSLAGALGPPPLPCFLAPVVPGVEECPGLTFPGTPLRFLPFENGHAAASFLVEATKPDSKLWIYVEVRDWDGPFQALMWQPPGGGGGGLLGMGTQAEVEASIFGQELVEVRKEIVASGDSYLGIGWTLPQGTHAFYVGAAAIGSLEGQFSLHNETGIRLLRELGGTSDLRRLREFAPVLQAHAGLQPALGAGVGAALFASTSVDVRHLLHAHVDGASIPAHAGWWGVEEPDGDLHQGPCAMASILVVSLGGCGLFVGDGMPGRWRFFAHADAGVGVFFPEPMLFLADIPHP